MIIDWIPPFCIRLANHSFVLIKRFFLLFLFFFLLPVKNDKETQILFLKSHLICQTRLHVYIYIILHNVIRKNKIIPKFDFILSSFFIIQSFAFSKGFHISFFEKNNKYNILYTKLSLLWLLNYNELIDRSIIINNHNDIISKKIPCNQISCRSLKIWGWSYRVIRIIKFLWECFGWEPLWTCMTCRVCHWHHWIKPSLMVTLYRALLASCEVIAPRFATAACLKFRVSMRTNFYFSSIVKATFLFLSFPFLNLTKAFYRPLRPCLIDILQRFLSVPLKTFRVTFSL